MAEETPKLPQSIYDALKSGEKIGKKPVPARIRKLIDRLKEHEARLKNDPVYRASILNSLKGITDKLQEEERKIAELNGIPQTFSVLEDFTHTTDERHIDGRRLFSPEQSSVRYKAGECLILWPTFLDFEAEGRRVSLWVWVENESGWIFRPGTLRLYLRKKYLKKEG